MLATSETVQLQLSIREREIAHRLGGKSAALRLTIPAKVSNYKLPILLPGEVAGLVVKLVPSFFLLYHQIGEGISELSRTSELAWSVYEMIDDNFAF